MHSFSDIVKCSEMSDIEIASNLIIDRLKREAIKKALTIEDTLLEILKNLDAESIKTATLVCKRWNEVISSSSVIMKRFKLSGDRMSGNERSTRKYLDVALSYRWDTDCRLLEFCFETSHVRSLSVEVCYWEFKLSWSKLAGLLTDMPNLESLSIDENGSSLSFNSPVKIVLPKLKRLVVESYSGYSLTWSLRFLDLLDVEQLTELDIYRNESSKSDRDSYINFVKHARNLKIWTLRRYDLDLIEYEEKLPFQLTTLNIVKQGFYDAQELNGQQVNHDNFKKFLIEQMPTMTDILIDYPDESVYQLVLTLQVCLEKLTIQKEFFPRDITFYDELKPLDSLKTLIVDDMHFHEKFLSKCRNLENLCCRSEISKDNLKFIATHLNLKHLQFFIREFTLTSSEATFKSLTSLTIWGVIGSIYRFVQCCPVLKVLDLQDRFRYVTEDYQGLDSLVDMILRNTNVQHLKLEAHVKSLKQNFDELNNDYDASRKLNLTLQVFQFEQCTVSHCILVQDTLRFPSFRSHKLDELYKKWQMKKESLSEKVVSRKYTNTSICCCF